MSAAVAEHLAQWRDLGWVRFGSDPAISGWLEYATPVAGALSTDETQRDLWLRHGGTWFAGVNILPNDVEGRVGGSGPLSGAAVDFVRAHLVEDPNWDKAQISVVYPGYPRQDPGESDAAARFRRDRDAAHVDGLLPVGAERRRMLREPHGFVLGLPMSETDADASPLVVWEGSHRMMQSAFRTRLKDIEPCDWPETDLTETYHAARRTCFETCPRRILHARPGEAYLIHRLALHGVAPWQPGAKAPPEGRMIAYFRPELADTADWLS
ncbi:MAG: hypothetical protein HKP40_02455 [Litoreibacter sp.]|nr:hypothetical protein [Litoreibacter sp.]